MSVLTCEKKAADKGANAKPLSNKEVYYTLNSLESEVLSLKSAHSSDAAKVQLLKMVLSSPQPPDSSFQQDLCSNASAYDWFMQEPYHTANHFGQLP
ncbi:hypothetical protein O181_057154 [Austropuccinia psidii MF-1]|uniref:Uncharacterized protein n=1 Tax=Austropuccinia psidii MF-1 TaxID=1389203 RepID=A0A9Q3E9V9_9BASI|nr:hypothetical protein [Austropuccinia psidii MF-1]